MTYKWIQKVYAVSDNFKVCSFSPLSISNNKIPPVFDVAPKVLPFGWIAIP